MKRLSWIFALILLTFVGDRIGGFIFQKLTEKSQFRYSRIYNGSADADILFVGNSRGLMFYQPHIEGVTGLNTLNISYNGMPMDLANVIVQDHFDKNNLPKVMVLDVTMIDRKNESLVSNFSCYRPYSERLDELICQASPKNFYGGNLSHLFLYNSEIFHRALYYLNKSDEDWLLDREMPQNLADLIVEEEPYTITTQDYLVENLKDLVKSAQNKGVEVRLVVNPYYPPFAEKITNLNEIIALVEDATDLKVHDYSIAFNEQKGFGDYQHLNKYGSKKYLDLLIKDGILEVKSEKLSLRPN